MSSGCLIAVVCCLWAVLHAGHTATTNAGNPCAAEYAKKGPRYRPIDGRCNNLLHADWGSAFSRAKRLMPAQYQDGLDYPRTLGKSGKLLKGAREISRVSSPERTSLTDLSVLGIAFGQMLAHDIVKFQQPYNKTCCINNPLINETIQNGTYIGGHCYPILLDKNETFFIGQKCKGFLRDVAFPNTGTVAGGPREQINNLTSYIDGSTLYGSTKTELQRLRGEDGKMLVTSENMLPPQNIVNCIITDRKTDYCMLAGHETVNVWPALGILHLAFVRYHNMLADTLSSLNSDWDADRIFEESRKIFIGVLQHIAFTEYLPVILDDATIRKHRLKPGNYRYQSHVNPQASHAFGVGAFRFGHSLVPQSIKVGNDTIMLETTMNNPHLVITRLEETTEGLAFSEAETLDRFFSHFMSNRLFETKPAAKNGIDLVAINIQRGRDHGLPSLNSFRKMCGLPPAKSFNSDIFVKNELSTVYEHVDDIDLYVGGFAEKPKPGSLMPPTFNCIIAPMFADLKYGDRFFYETSQPEGFSQAQLKEIKSMTLSSLICSIMDIPELQGNVFYTPHKLNNPLKSCQSMKQLDLSKWMDTSSQIVWPFMSFFQ